MVDLKTVLGSTKAIRKQVILLMLEQLAKGEPVPMLVNADPKQLQSLVYVKDLKSLFKGKIKGLDKMRKVEILKTIIKRIS